MDKLRRYAQAIGIWCLGIGFSLGLFLSPIALATGVIDLPPLDPSIDWVIDQADVISPLTQGKLEQTLSRLASQTGTAIRMVTLRRLDYGETPASFATQLFQRWYPTPIAQEHQVLVVLDTVTHGTALHQGELVPLTPEIATSISQETMRTPLREGNYNQSFLDAADRLRAILSGETDPGPPEIKIATADSSFPSAAETDGKSATLIVVGLLLAATIIPMVTYFIYQSSS
jgi:uncharacterized protein